MNALFIVAHPDDEVLGACGTISRLKARGDRVAVFTLSSRSATRETGLAEKQRETHKALNVDETYQANYETMKFGSYDRFEMTKAIEEVLRKEQPDLVFTHDGNDIHNDHRVLASIVLEAIKLPLRHSDGCKAIEGVYAMEIPSSSDWGSGFLPNAYFRIEEPDLWTKAAVLDGYDDVLRDMPHPRNFESFRALARVRGGQCGCMYAEAFKKITEVNQ